MQYNAIQYNAIQCNTIQCNAMQCNAMQCIVIWYGRILFIYRKKSTKKTKQGKINNNNKINNNMYNYILYTIARLIGTKLINSSGTVY